MSIVADRRRKPSTVVLSVAVVVSIGIAIGGSALLNEPHRAGRYEVWES